MSPAFEAVRCAERQGLDLADDLDWAIRGAFFAESRRISMRHVLLELAAGVGLDMAGVEDDVDGGVAERLVVEEAREGWERLEVEGSPTFVLPSGRQASYPGLPKVELDKERNDRPVRVHPAPCSGAACLDHYRRLLDEAAGG